MTNQLKKKIEEIFIDYLAPKVKEKGKEKAHMDDVMKKIFLHNLGVDKDISALSDNLLSLFKETMLEVIGEDLSDFEGTYQHECSIENKLRQQLREKVNSLFGEK